MASFGLLDQTEEDALHASRLLNVEEKLFKRLTKRLLTPTASIYTQPSPNAAIPEDSDATEPAAASDEEHFKRNKERQQWREDAFLDFAAFESNIVRVQFLLDSNERERQRYAEEKLRIIDTARSVRENNTELHEQLKEAQGTLALRKQYDELANQITQNQKLRPRDEQHAQLNKLNAEIADLERESREYSKTWAERREQFGRIVEEGEQMLRLIRDEKEEAERKEGMEEVAEADEGEHSAARSGAGTPKPMTPSHTSQTGENDDSLDRDRLSVPHTSTRNSRAGTPNRDSKELAMADEDATMDDADTRVVEDNESKGEDEEGQVSEEEADGMEVT